MLQRLLCTIGRHRDRVDYQRIGTFLHYLAVCTACGRSRPAEAVPGTPQVMRIPTRRERREMARRQRRGDPTARVVVLGGKK